MDNTENVVSYEELLCKYTLLKKKTEHIQNIGIKYIERLQYDYKTLLNSMSGYMYAAFENADSSLKSPVDGALKTTKILTAKVNDMADCMSILMGGYSAAYAPVQLKHIFRQVSQEIDELASIKSTSFEYEIDETVSDYIITDYNAVKKTIYILVENALTNSGADAVSACVKKVSESKENVTININITDNGKGVDMNVINAILNDESGHFTHINHGEFVGFGLLIAKNFLKAVNSSLIASNRKEKGASFSFLLTVGKIVSEHKAAEEDGDRTLEGLKILLADDSAIIQQMTKQVIERLGAHVTTVVNGREAVDKFSECEFDAVIMDVEMPVLNGRDASKEIREIKKVRNLSSPIIGMTAHSGQTEYDKCIDSGMDTVVRKPFRIDDLISAIFRLLYHEEYVSAQKDDGSAKPSIYKFDSIKGIDYKGGINHLGGNDKLYFELLQKFRDNYSDIIQNISLLLKTGNDAEVKNQLHLIKGVSGNLSFNEIYDYVGKLKEAVDDDDFPEISKYLGLLDDALNEFVQSFNIAEVDILSNMAQLLDMDLMFVKTRMNDLIQCLTADVDLGGAIDACDDIFDYMQKTEHKSEFARIKDAINSFDTELAAALLKPFVEKF